MQKEFFKWIDEALKTNDSTLITAICFNIYETEENLKNKDFSDILYTWDCG